MIDKVKTKYPEAKIILAGMQVPPSMGKKYGDEFKAVSYTHLDVYKRQGDGNLHLFVSCGENTPETRHRVEEIVFLPLQKIGGSITAEHGIGLEKKPWLHLSRTTEELALMRTLKQALDPKGCLLYTSRCV